MNYKTICETDADFLLQYEILENDGFAFKYAKWKDNNLQQYVNCNGKVFGPYEDLSRIYVSSGKAEWTVYQDDIKQEYSDDGNKCETKKPKKSKKKKGMEVLTQDEIDKLLTAIAEGEANAPEEEYDEETHILKLNRKKQEFFVAGKKRFGPYHQIFKSEYLDEEHFQFTYNKRAHSKRWYYNCNGKEIGPFNTSNYMTLRYNEQNQAVLDDFNDGNYIYIDGKKIKCFDKSYRFCQHITNSNHEIFVGKDSNGNYHFKRDGIKSDISAGSVTVLNNGDVVYSKKENGTETWFYNDTPISVTINGFSSGITNSFISYCRKHDNGGLTVPYFMMKGKEFQGVIEKFYEPGFAVCLQSGKILLLIQDFPSFYKDGYLNEKYDQQCEGNYIRLYNTHRLAGRD